MGHRSEEENGGRGTRVTRACGQLTNGKLLIGPKRVKYEKPLQSTESTNGLFGKFVSPAFIALMTSMSITAMKAELRILNCAAQLAQMNDPNIPKHPHQFPFIGGDSLGQMIKVNYS
ncbi:hypothetical protein XENORESO_021238 [Xenotaenia resolanae]|uniref:Uncharacterized protein n=1 Tax=Xenotaenia resolanae TaxID=208358 RepID=A0ABV0X3Q3_9TELE